MQINGNKIREMREARGFNLVDFAEKAGLSPSYLSEIERGAKKPSLKTLGRIAAVLNVPREEIVDISQEDEGLTFGDRVRLARQNKGWTVTELAQKVGLSPAYISEVEKDKVIPAVSTMRRLAQVLEVSVPALLNENAALGLKVRMLREEQGLTQAALAGAAGISAGMVAQIEQGKVQPSFRTIERIAQVLGVSPCYFVMDNEKPEEIITSFSPQLRELLQDENVQAVLRQICHMSEREIRFILNFIQLYRKSRLDD